MPWSKQKFLDVLSLAHKAERAWVSARRDEGRAIAHGKKLVLPDHNPKKDFCPTPDAVAAVQIEIKVRNLTFTSPLDFPYDTIFVDDITGLAKGGSPFAWVYISQKTGSWVWLSALDRDDSWTEQVIWDSLRGFNVATLVAPADYLRHADELRAVLFASDSLQWVEGEVGGFREGEEPVDKCDPRPPKRDIKPKKPSNKRVGG